METARPQLVDPRGAEVENSEATENLPAELPPLGDPLASMAALPVSLQIFFNDQLFERCKAVAHYIAKADGVAPRHLIGKPEACFAVISRALTWRLDPYAVASATYQTPGGQVGFYGSLCQAIIENSGRLVGGVRFEHYGDWSRLRGKFKILTSEKGGKYPAPDWRPEDEIGLGVTVSAQMRGEEERRTMPFDLVQAFPRNSTLWATDPRTQIIYTAVRRFATSTVPTLFMGVPFDREDIGDLAPPMQDITPPRSVPEQHGEAQPAAAAEAQAETSTPRRRGRPPGRATAPAASTAPAEANPAPASPPPPPAAEPKAQAEPQPEQAQPARTRVMFE